MKAAKRSPWFDSSDCKRDSNRGEAKEKTFAQRSFKLGMVTGAEPTGGRLNASQDALKSID